MSMLRRRNTTEALSKVLTEDGLVYLRAQFELLEPNRDGTVSLDNFRKVVKLQAFSKSENIVEALEAITKINEGAPTKGLRKFFKAHCNGETLGVVDSKLENANKEKLGGAVVA